VDEIPTIVILPVFKATLVKGKRTRRRRGRAFFRSFSVSEVIYHVYDSRHAFVYSTNDPHLHSSYLTSLAFIFLHISSPCGAKSMDSISNLSGARGVIGGDQWTFRAVSPSFYAHMAQIAIPVSSCLARLLSVFVVSCHIRAWLYFLHLWSGSFSLR